MTTKTKIWVPRAPRPPATRTPPMSPPRGGEPASDEAAGGPRRGALHSARQRPRIDPRFARRWIQVRREQGLHRLRILLVALTLVALIALVIGSLYSPLFEVRHVRIFVNGSTSAVGSRPEASSLSDSEVLTVTGLSHRRPLIEVDAPAMAARLDAIADLGGARVSRSWPTTVRVQVTVRIPVALVARTPAAATGAGWATVDATGRILAFVSSPVAGLPVIQGAGPVPVPGQWLEGSAGPDVAPPLPAGPSLADLNAAADTSAVPAGPAAALALLVALPASVRSEVLSVSVESGGQLSMAVLPADIASGSIPVILGDGSELAQKLTALVTLLTQADVSGVTAIDLTVPDRPAALTTRQSPGTLSTQPGG
jgi:cell division septal protein FtsQ